MLVQNTVAEFRVLFMKFREGPGTDTVEAGDEEQRV